MKFHTGQVFNNVDMVRKAIRQYSCQNRWDIKLPVNDKKRIKARCAGGVKKECSWYLWASVDSKTEQW